MKATIIGTAPSKANCYRIAGNKLIKTPALKKYESDFYIQVPSFYRNKDITGFFELHVDVYYPSQRADLDNSLKCILDCLQAAKAIRNDRKCVKIVAERYVDIKNPRIEFMIIEVGV